MSTKVTELTELAATPDPADVLYIVDSSEPSATASKKITAQNLVSLSPVQSVAGRTGAVTLAAADVSGLGGAALLSVGTGAGTVAESRR